MATGTDSVEDLFEATLPLSCEERTKLLDRRCEGQLQLRRTVEMLLAAHDDAGSFLSQPLLELSKQVPPAAESLSTADVSPQSDASRVFRVGDIIVGRFAIHRFVARGGMGEVWEAWDSQVQERVAIKTIRPGLARSAEAVERFRLEVRQARAISHQNVCRIHDLYTAETAPGTSVTFLCMEFLEGPTLSEYLKHHGPFEPNAAYELVEQLVHGLKSAHAQGVVHRDLKSQNIMLVNSGPGRMRAVITDFGLAINVLASSRGREEREGQGTPDYMAPEQRLTGNVTALADQYALGVVMCEMITGSRPVRDEHKSAVGGSPVRLPSASIPARWTEVLRRCLATHPHNRFPDLDCILRDLKSPRRRGWSWAVAATFFVSFMALLLWTWVRHPRPVEATTLAVLPLRNKTGDNKLEYLSAGFTQALTNDLAGMPDLQVKAEEIAQQYANEHTDPVEFGRRLQVSSLVSGSLLSQGDSVRVPIEIIDVKTGAQLWGKTYEGQTANLAQLQSEISTDVAYHLKIRLNPNLKARLVRQYATAPAAYDGYLKGRYKLAQRTPEKLREAVEDFQRALSADPHYAPAYAGLADSYNLLAHYSSGHPIPMIRNALEAANQALALDSTLGEAYASRGLSRTLLSYEWREAENDYGRAVELNPSHVNGHLWYALALLTPQGRDVEAQGQLSYVQAANPDSALTIMSLAMAAYCGQRQTQSAHILEEHFETIKHLEPAVDLLASDYLALNRPYDAIHLLQQTAVEKGEEHLRARTFSTAFAQAGNFAEAARWFAVALKSDQDRGNSSLYVTALYYNLGGNKNKAMDALETAYVNREPDLIFVNVDPLLMSLHSAPRFHKLLQRLNLE